MPSLVHRVQTFVLGNAFVRRVTMLAGGTALGQACVVLSTPLITRLYDPDALGKFGLLLTFTNVCFVLVAFSYELAIVSANSDEDAAHLTTLSVGLSIVNSFVAAAVLYSFIQFDIFGFGTLPLFTVLWVIPLLGFSSIFFTLKYWSIRFEQFKVVSSVIVVQNVGRSIGQVFLGFLPFGWFGLLAGEAFGRGAGLGTLLRRNYKAIRLHSNGQNRHRLKEVAQQYINFPKFFLPSTLLNILAINLPLPIIIYLHGAEAGGQYFLAHRVLALPLSLISGGVADVFHSQASLYMQNQPEKIRGFFLKTSSTLFLIGLLPVTFLAIAGEPLFAWFAGAQWIEAGRIIALMAPAALAGLAVSPLGRLVCVVDGQKWKLLYDSAILLTQFIVFYAGSVYKLSLLQVVGLSSGLTVLSYGVYFVVLLSLATRVAKAKVVTEAS